MENIAYSISLLLLILLVVSLGRIFAKAGQPGWVVLLPIFNIYVLLKIAGMSGWWVLPLLVPGANIIVWIIVAVELASEFGKGSDSDEGGVPN